MSSSCELKQKVIVPISRELITSVFILDCLREETLTSQDFKLSFHVCIWVRMGIYPQLFYKHIRVRNKLFYEKIHLELKHTLIIPVGWTHCLHTDLEHSGELGDQCKVFAVIRVETPRRHEQSV